MCCLFNDHALLSVLQKFLPGFWGCLSTLTIDLLAHDMHAIAHWLRDAEMQGVQPERHDCIPCISGSLSQCAIARMSCASQSMVSSLHCSTTIAISWVLC